MSNPNHTIRKSNRFKLEYLVKVSIADIAHTRLYMEAQYEASVANEMRGAL
jgi:hypothetical protein